MMQAMFTVHDELIDALEMQEVREYDTIQVLFSESLFLGERPIIDWYKCHLEMVMIHSPQACDGIKTLLENRAIMQKYLSDRPKLVEMSVRDTLDYIKIFTRAWQRGGVWD